MQLPFVWSPKRDCRQPQATCAVYAYRRRPTASQEVRLRYVSLLLAITTCLIKHTCREEEKVAKALAKAGIDFKREHQITFGCWDDTFASADFVISERGQIFLLEVDEEQHEWYIISCEVSRMTKVHAALAIEGNTLPLVFIRYNPHAVRKDGRLLEISTSKRLDRLISVIQSWEYDSQQSLQIQYMYYNCHTTDEGLKLDIWDSSDYNSDVRSCCSSPLV